MKHTFALFFAFVFCILSAQAQKYRLGISFSPQLQWSGIDNTDFGTDNSRVTRDVNLGFSYGLDIDYSGSEESNYALATGFQVVHSYRRFTNESKALNLVSSESYTYRTTFVEIPLAFKMMTNEIGYARYFAQFGTNLDFRVRSREDYDDNGQGLDYKNEDSDRVNFFNPSLNVGLGTEYNLFGQTSAIIGIFYNNGFTNMIKDGDDERIVFRNINLKLGIMF